jgi:DNA-binding beta-propeller fold protein YncE
MYFVEMRNHIVRRVDYKTKMISTIAGTGRQGFGGDGGRATDARFSQPHSIALDRAGAVYVADIGNHRIRRIDPVSGVVESIAGSTERRLPRDGQAARGNPILGPRALFIDSDTMWIALREGHSIWRMNLADGILHHVAGTGKAGFAGDGGPARQAEFNGPKGIAVGPDGNVFVADTENHAIRMIDLQSGLISTIGRGKGGGQIELARGGTAASAKLNRPHGICVAADGTVYSGDTLNHRVVRLK